MASQQNIRCSVSNCHYYGNDNTCHANEIMVTSNEMSEELSGSIDNMTATQLTETPVSNSVGSCCKTFIPANSDKAFQDGVTPSATS
ncbi:MAG: DUF1540 domain-containing protein [Bacillota bacterium]